MPRRKTNQEFLKEMQDKVGDSYIFLQPYVNTKTALACFHEDCGRVIYIRPDSLLNNKGCNDCYGSHKRTIQQVKDDLYKVHGNKIVLAKDAHYSGTAYPIRVHCTVCNFEWSPRYVDLLAGHGCPNCYGTVKRNTKSYQAKLDKLYGHVYEVLSPYIDSSSKIKVKHLPCGNVWSPVADELIQREACSKCHKQKTLAEFKKELYDLVGDEYVALSKTGDNTYMIRHSCGLEYEYNGSKILHNGQRCPRCTSMSCGEVLVSEVLDKYNIKYIYQKSFNDLRYKKKLRFDFYLPTLNTCIEYDGKQHFQPVEYFGGLKTLKGGKIRDNLKDYYCHINRINLIRIPYTFNTISKVDKYIKSHIGIIKNRVSMFNKGSE